MKKNKKIHKGLLTIIIVLLVLGTVTLVSASLGILTSRENVFWAMMLRHVGIGVIGGFILMLGVSKIPLTFWKKYSPYFFIGALVATLLVFVPGLGFGHGGARRWISLGFISFQPAELLKLASVLFFSAWLDKYKDQIQTLKYGLMPFAVVSVLCILVLFRQPDTGTIVLTLSTLGILYFISGASLKHVGISILSITLLSFALISTSAYVRDRVDTFLNPEKDPFGSSYQIRQSRIAIGAGGLSGRGLGQSVHKFGSYLPESNSDSVFAIYAEEYGFAGSIVLIILYCIFAFKGVKISQRSKSHFSRNLGTGIVLLIVIQVFFNIAAISGIVPLSGLPLIFMSNGGTALVSTLGSLGILLAISRGSQKRRKIQRIS